MSLGASRRKRAKSEKIDDVAPAATGEEQGGEMKQLQPRRGEGPYSMVRLERAITQLVDGQGILLARIEALEKALLDRDHLVEELEARVKAGEAKRARALESIDRLIDQLDELEGRAESAAFPRLDDSPTQGR